MSARAVERQIQLALKKQRLQMRAEQQREEMLARLEGVETVLGLVDRARDAAQGLRKEAPLLVVGALLLAVLRPRFVLRLARRAWFGWLLYRRLGHALAPLFDALRRFAA